MSCFQFDSMATVLDCFRVERSVLAAFCRERIPHTMIEDGALLVGSNAETVSCSFLQTGFSPFGSSFQKAIFCCGDFYGKNHSYG